MPDIPEEYEGLNQEVVEEIEEEQKKESEDEKTTSVLGLELWQLTVAVVGGMLFIGLLVWAILKLRTKIKQRK